MTIPWVWISLFLEALHTQQFLVIGWGDLNDHFFSTSGTDNLIEFYTV
jgi:hypothetical protein